MNVDDYHKIPISEDEYYKSNGPVMRIDHGIETCGKGQYFKLEPKRRCTDCSDFVVEHRSRCDWCHYVYLRGFDELVAKELLDEPRTTYCPKCHLPGEVLPFVGTKRIPTPKLCGYHQEKAYQKSLQTQPKPDRFAAIDALIEEHCGGMVTTTLKKLSRAIVDLIEEKK